METGEGAAVIPRDLRYPEGVKDPWEDSKLRNEMTRVWLKKFIRNCTMVTEEILDNQVFRKYTVWETTDNKRTTINSEKHMALLVVFKACILYKEEEVVDGRSYAELCLNYGYKTSSPNSFRTSR